MKILLSAYAVGLFLAYLNLRGTVKLWRSDSYTRGQIWAQSILIWVIPGFVFVVMHVLKNGHGAPLAGDSDVGDPGIHPYIMSGSVDPPHHTGGGGHGP